MCPESTRLLSTWVSAAATQRGRISHLVRVRVRVRMRVRGRVRVRVRVRD